MVELVDSNFSKKTFQYSFLPFHAVWTRPTIRMWFRNGGFWLVRTGTCNARVCGKSHYTPNTSDLWVEQSSKVRDNFSGTVYKLYWKIKFLVECTFLRNLLNFLFWKAQSFNNSNIFKSSLLFMDQPILLHVQPLDFSTLYTWRCKLFFIFPEIFVLFIYSYFLRTDS